MSGKGLLYVIDQEIQWLTISERAIYKIIARKCISSRVCSYPAKEIAKQVGCTTRTVSRAIEVLEACLAINVERAPGKKWSITLGDLWGTRECYELDLSQYDRSYFSKIVEIDARRKTSTPDTMSKTLDIVSSPPPTLCPQTPDTMSSHKSIESSLKAIESSSRFPSRHYASVSFDPQSLKLAVEELVARIPESAKYFQGTPLPSKSKSTTCCPPGVDL